MNELDKKNRAYQRAQIYRRPIAFIAEWKQRESIYILAYSLVEASVRALEIRPGVEFRVIECVQWSKNE